MPMDKKDSGSYMDGVPVKISEKYKRRPVIRLPNSCLNCSPGPALSENYNFGLEASVLTKLDEWKKIRQHEVEKFEEKAKRWYEKEDEIEKLNKLTIESTNKSSCSEEASSNVILPSVNGVHSTILQPTNAPERPSKVISQAKPNNFKISDFETDNSSPFDNMELKTINDMEVLASVLSQSQPSSGSIAQVTNDTYIPKTNGWNSWNAYPTYSSQQQYYAPSHYGSPPAPVYTPMYPAPVESHLGHPPQTWHQPTYVTPTYPVTGAHTAYSTALPYSHTPAEVIHSVGMNNSQPLKSSSKSVPDLALELEKEMKEYKMAYESKRLTKTPPPRTSAASIGLENWQPWPDLESPHRSVADVIAVNVSPLARNISEMGFPLERVLRSLEKFSGDDKKAIEFLLQVQRLEERKFKGELVERALHINNYDEKAAEKHLEAVGVLLDLGFDIDRAEKALVESKNDRDAALELLIS